MLPEHNYVAPNSILSPLTDQIMDAQADLQWALGVQRCVLAENMSDFSVEKDGQMIADYMQKTLARLHALLDALGRPMYDPSRHPEVPEKL